MVSVQLRSLLTTFFLDPPYQKFIFNHVPVRVSLHEWRKLAMEGRREGSIGARVGYGASS